MKTLTIPPSIRATYGAFVIPAQPTALGCFRLTRLESLQAGGSRDARLVFRLVDENGKPLANHLLFAAYSTGPDSVPYFDDVPDRLAEPPTLLLFQAHGNLAGDLQLTEGDGETEVIGSGGLVVKAGGRGGVSAYVPSPYYSSDLVVGLGMTASHQGLYVEFTLDYAGVEPLTERVAALEEKLAKLESVIDRWQE